MKEILGKDIRRINNINELEAAFIESIKKGFNSHLELSDRDAETDGQQYYLLSQDPMEQLPF